MLETLMPGEGISGWADVEVMGHRRYVGRISEQIVAGHSMIRIEVPGHPLPVFVGGGSLYCLTILDEADALRIAAVIHPTRLQQLAIAGLVEIDRDAADWEQEQAEQAEREEHPRNQDGEFLYDLYRAGAPDGTDRQ